jgi:hypothetical protein
MPDAAKVWMTEADYPPRTLWMMARDGQIPRLKGGVHDELKKFERWKNNSFYGMKVGNRELHLGIDTKTSAE